MQTEIHQGAGQDNKIAFLVGAVFNMLVSVNVGNLLERALTALIGGLIWLMYQVIANRLANKKPGTSKKKKSKVSSENK
jgi:hypothetical protein